MTSQEEIQTLVQPDIPVEVDGTTVDNTKNLAFTIDPAGKRVKIDQILLSVLNVTGNISVFLEMDLGEGDVSLEEYEKTITAGKGGNLLDGAPLILNGRPLNIYLQDAVNEDLPWHAEVTWTKVDIDADQPL